MVLQWREGPNFPLRAFEDRAVVCEWLAVLRALQQPAGYRNANSLAAKRMAIGSGQSVHVGGRRAEHTGPSALSHGRQHSTQILRKPGKLYEQGRVLAHRGHGMRAWWWRQLCWQFSEGSQAK